MLIEKYKPKSLKEIIGREKEIAEIKANLNKKPILLYGPVGVGKTTIVYCLANDLNYEILELNASDFRNKESIQKILGNAIQQKSLFYKGKLILVDELDGIAGKEDRGGVQALLNVIKKSPYPIIMVANDPWNKKLLPIRKISKLIELKVNFYIVLKVLKEICKKEKININEAVLAKIAKSAKHDIRAAIIDLNVYLKTRDTSIIDTRDKEETIFQILQKIFHSRNPQDVLNVLEYSSIDLDGLIKWLDENLPREINGRNLLKAYESLSKADIFKARIQRWQHWRFLVYVNALLTYGINIFAKKSGFVKYKNPTRFLKFWINKQENSELQEIASSLHMSTKKLEKELPYIRKILNL